MQNALEALEGPRLEVAHNKALAVNIISRVSVDARGCWKWQSTIDPGNGYGRLSFGGHKLYAHRASHIAFKGPIDAGLSVLHKCDCKDCANPDHTYLGTQADNMADYVARTEKWERRGKLRPAQVLEIVAARFNKGRSYLELAERFHVSCQTISNICRGRAYAKLTGIKKDQKAPKVKTKAAAKMVDKAFNRANKAKGK